MQTLEITSVAPQLNFDNAARADGFQAEVLNELPLQVAGGMRYVQSFVVLLPGVSTGGGNNDDARINGGMVSGDEAILDGASMQEGVFVAERDGRRLRLPTDSGHGQRVPGQNINL